MPVSVLVDIGHQTGLDRLVQAYTTTELFVAQEMRKPNRLVRTPKEGPLLKIIGYGRYHNAVGRPPNIEPQPVVPGR